MQINYDYLRPKKAKVLEEWHNEEFYKKEELLAESYKNATILPLKRIDGDNLLFGRGGVVAEDGTYVEHSAIDRRVQFPYEFHNADQRDLKVVYCGYLVNQWGHFLVEAVSRLWYFLESDLTIDKYVFFVDYDSGRVAKGNYKQFFELLGVWDKIEIINKPTTYKEVVVPELGYKWRDYFSQKQKNVFETIARNVKPEGSWKTYEKIYFTRSQLGKATDLELGLEMLDNYFENNGYHIVAPEKLSLAQLVYLIRNAKECASISGSLPHNMLFAQDGKKLIIMERNVLNNEIQVDVNRIKGLNVTYIDANIAIYPVNLGVGPFILSYKGLLEKYTIDSNALSVDEKYRNGGYLKICFKKYMKAYRKTYHYQWFMHDWSMSFTDYIREAYLDSLQYYGDYLYGNKPYRFIHYFQLHYIKQFIKRFIRR